MKTEYNLKRIRVSIILSLSFILPSLAAGDIYNHEYPSEHRYRYSGESIKTVNGKFYAYVVLLFNDNPHFVNLIQKGTYPIRDIGVEGRNIKAFRSYINSVQDTKLSRECEQVLKIYLEPDSFGDNQLKQMEKILAGRNIVLKFYREGSFKGARITLDYCIFGEKIKIGIKHPLFEISDEIYYIKPYIYYDEISTSNSTFYYDMIYINPDEVNNDYIIARNIIKGKDVKNLLFVGSKVTDDIRFCIKMAFRDNSPIRNEIWKMFVIHELTHKYLENRFNHYDQISGEEISLSSTIYSNPYLGLSVMYSYLNYERMNPHRVAAMNYISYISEASGNKDFINRPGEVKNIPLEKLREITKNHFNHCVSRLHRGR